MKVYTWLFLSLIVSCTEKKTPSQDVHMQKTPPGTAAATTKKDSALQHWLEFYRTTNPDFSAEKFNKEETAAINFQPTALKILNREGFNEIYMPFLVFNDSRAQYIDFDSGHWFPAKDGSPSYDADQRVILAHPKRGKAWQIAFFGPSYRVEEAYWKGDSVAVLLGNTYEKVPFMQEYDFKQKKVRTILYADTLTFEQPYSALRMQLKGFKN